MKNINELIAAQSRLFEDVVGQKIDIARAEAAANAAGKIIDACAVEIDYAKALGKKPNVPFLNTGK